MTTLKSDSQNILKTIDKLCIDLADTSKNWWPQYLFHCSDITNILNILESDKLYSRNSLKHNDIGFNDIASSDVIENTQDQWKDYARLYFRPKTPTQYHNEGFRPQDNISLKASCPFPIYLMFNSKKILTRENTVFSDGNLGSTTTNTGTDAKFFNSLDFSKIYHAEPLMDNYEKKDIIHHRCAEVAIPDFLDLSALEYIWCRSKAEMDTLLNLLTQNTRKKFKNRIGCSERNNLFFAEWAFVESVNLNEDKIIFTFNLPLKNGPFDLRFEFKDYSNRKTYISQNTDYQITKDLTLEVPNNLNTPLKYSVKLYIDDHIAYYGIYDETIDNVF